MPSTLSQDNPANLFMFMCFSFPEFECIWLDAAVSDDGSVFVPYFVLCGGCLPLSSISFHYLSLLSLDFCHQDLGVTSMVSFSEKGEA